MSTYEPIASQTLASAASEIVFSSLPQNYTDLILVGNVIRTASSDTRIQVNGDTSSLYSYTFLGGNGSSASSFRVSNAAQWDVGYQAATTPTTLISNFQNYSNGATFKTVLSRASASAGDVAAFTSLYRSTSPITSIRIFQTSGNLASGSTFTIYGVAAGNSSAKASGGNIVTTDGSYWYHTFTSSGVFIPSQALTVDYLVVAGGGGGGALIGGGGGAGGLRSTVTATGGGGTLETALSLSANTVYQAIIGAGAAGGSISNVNGFNGSNSVFSTITSTGGGAGGANDTNGATGGSGGGGGGSGVASKTGGSFTANQGFAGGNNFSQAGRGPSGGGGGAGVAGTAGSSNLGGNGGNGVAVAISGSSITYAGGGGGGIISATAGTGGTGGGGAGSTTGLGTAGVANLGAGGGGAGGGSAAGGNGGSGIIIVRYAV
jgi:hypothetical protein